MMFSFRDMLCRSVLMIGLLVSSTAVCLVSSGCIHRKSVPLRVLAMRPLAAQTGGAEAVVSPAGPVVLAVRVLPDYLKGTSLVFLQGRRVHRLEGVKLAESFERSVASCLGAELRGLTGGAVWETSSNLNGNLLVTCDFVEFAIVDGVLFEEVEVGIDSRKAGKRGKVRLKCQFPLEEAANAAVTAENALDLYEKAIAWTAQCIADEIGDSDDR